MPDQKDVVDLGGTLRLGSFPCEIKEGTIARELYGKASIEERHRHRYEFNNRYKEQLEAEGMVFSGTSPDGRLVEMIELRDHPYFVAVQFHPEFQSRPTRPHPLFQGLINACVK
jgi:CTP synthase